VKLPPGVLGSLIKWLAITCGLAGCNAGSASDEDFGRRLRAQCESVYRQVTEISEREHDASLYVHVHDYAKRLERMSAAEKAAEEAAYRRMKADMKDTDEELLKWTEERQRLSYVSTCITERAKTQQAR
jgi:hypothetical protein